MKYRPLLRDNGVNAVNRKSRGEDIDAGCGQLRSRFISGNNKTTVR